MEDEEGLFEKARTFQTTISEVSHKNENIMVAAHHDADGICGASLLTDFIHKKNGHAQVRSTSEPSPKFLEVLNSAKYDFVIFVDICSGLAEEIARKFGDKWLVIDHHEIPESEMNHERIINPFQFGFDGTTAASSSTLCNFITSSSTERDSYLSAVGSLGDRQDVGPRRSLIGLNAKVLGQDTDERKDIKSKFDLLFSSRETKPVHESIAGTFSFFIPGLTGNKDACLASLRGAGIEMKANTRWRTLADFSEDEKQRLLEAIVPHLSGTTYTVEDLVGSVYSSHSKDEFSFSKDARDFALVLSICGRMGRPGLGLSLCMGGDEAPLSSELEKIIDDYRLEIVRAVQLLAQSEDRINEKSEYAIVVGDGVVSERMTGAVCQIFSSLLRFKNKAVLLRTTTQDGDVKISARCGKERQDLDLGNRFRELAKKVSGAGGGLKNAAGLKFSIAKQQDFQQMVSKVFESHS